MRESHRSGQARRPRVTRGPRAIAELGDAFNRNVAEIQHQRTVILREQHAKQSALLAMAGALAHDLSNLLTMTLACSEATELAGEGEITELLDDSLEATNRCVALARQLQDFSGRLAHNVLPVALAPLLERVCASVGNNPQIEVRCCALSQPILASAFWPSMMSLASVAPSSASWSAREPRC